MDADVGVWAEEGAEAELYVGSDVVGAEQGDVGRHLEVHLYGWVRADTTGAEFVHVEHSGGGEHGVGDGLYGVGGEGFFKEFVDARTQNVDAGFDDEDTYHCGGEGVEHTPFRT